MYSENVFKLLGMGKGTVSRPGEENRDAYLQLSVRILVAFCHVPDIAASEEMISKIPLILEILSNQCVRYRLTFYFLHFYINQLIIDTN